MPDAPKPLLQEELRAIIAAFGGKQVFAEALPARIRTVDRWLAGTRRIRPLTAARIRSLAKPD